jgi:hypothetical protein
MASMSRGRSHDKESAARTTDEAAKSKDEPCGTAGWALPLSAMKAAPHQANGCRASGTGMAVVITFALR